MLLQPNKVEPPPAPHSRSKKKCIRGNDMSHFLKDLASLFAITAFCVVIAVVLGAL